ncbi:LANO_0H22870g1_1 [Lachancea nothofagi CBS 11611]|uniref:LANO_0H22870g1_1 n=1 Tax=Lachancea nothofagi CBS 11611 TaxID=1266666 RepID=A0A1G4KNJ9_9SACH|nr:LANO_0H22870g1_1 [Lachancea nothofagi CBS 11611]
MSSTAPNTSLETLQEEAGVSGSSGPARIAERQQVRKLRGKSGAYPEPSNVFGSTSGSDSSSKTIGLGIARRPSDNLLQNLAQEHQQQQQQHTMSQPPSRKKLVSNHERPLSNDSILTQNSNLFSSNASSTAWSSNDSSRGSSIIDELSTDNVKRVGDEASFAETDGESTIDLTSVVGSEYSASTQQNLPSHLPQQQPKQQQTKTRYVFTNSSLARSQSSFTASNPSPLKNNFNRNSAPTKLYSKSTSALAQQQPVHQQQSAQHQVLTPSQRYRMRKEQNKTALQNSIKQKEKYYDEQETLPSSPYAEDAEIGNNFIWNIPVASNSTNSFLMSLKPPQKKNRSKSSIGFSRSSSQNSGLSETTAQYLDYNEMPPLPIAGLGGCSDFQSFQQTSDNLSSVYQHSSNKFSKSKLWERTNSMEVLPLQFKTASEEGMEDLRLVSEDKVQICSPSRPTWLPPKGEYERKSHEEKINKTMSMASLDQLDRSRERDECSIRDETNRQKYVLLIDRGLTRQSSLHDLKKIVWETQLMADIRPQVYDTLLQSEAKMISEQYIESFQKLSNVLNKMHFPHGKLTEIEKLVAKIPSTNPLQHQEDLVLLLKLKSISSQGLLPGDELLFYHFLIDCEEPQQEQIWDMVNLIQLTCFNDTTKEKFDSRVVSPRGVVAHYVCKNAEYESEFNSGCLNITTWWNILQRMEHSMFMWCMDVIVVHNSQCYKNSPVLREKTMNKTWDAYKSQHVIVNYKVLAALMLNVLLNYHFGFNNLQSLGDLRDQDYRIPCSMDQLLDDLSVHEVFLKKWRYYYKKF